jgi:signal transduction histidine kinase
MEGRLESVDLGNRARALVERFGMRAERHGVRLTVKGTTGATLLDAGLIDRLLWNLVDNAIRFAPPGGHVEVSTNRRGEELVLEVADDGPGVPAVDRERIFERFFRGDAARTATGSEGTGLGLSISRAIVLAHRGSITVTTSERGGALFRVRLPAISARAFDVRRAPVVSHT